MSTEQLNGKHVKRNQYRGLQGFIASTYDLGKTDEEMILKTLQLTDRWKGVGLSSVRTAVRNIRVAKEEGATTSPPVKARKAKVAPAPDVLITIPLPKRQSATLKYSEARDLYNILQRVFGA